MQAFYTVGGVPSL